MGVVLTFSKTTGEEISKGPYASVRFEGEQIRDGENGGPIAAHQPHGWSVDGADYLRLDATGRVTVTWEGHPQSAATTGHFSSINGVAYIDRRILAFMDRERNDWYLVREGQHHRVLTLKLA